MYPLVLNEEELFCLRAMVRTVLGKRLMEAITAARLDPALTADRFSNRIISLYDCLLDMDLPLLMGSQGFKRPGTSSVVVSMPDRPFQGMKKFVLPVKFYGDESMAVITQRINDAQPAIRAAFEVAEENSSHKQSVSPNVPPARALN